MFFDGIFNHWDLDVLSITKEKGLRKKRAYRILHVLFGDLLLEEMVSRCHGHLSEETFATQIWIGRGHPHDDLSYSVWRVKGAKKGLVLLRRRLERIEGV